MHRAAHTRAGDSKRHVRFADRLGEGVARGHYSATWATHLLAGTMPDLGQRMRLIGIMHDSNIVWISQLSRTEWLVRSRVRTLADARETSDVILADAISTNDDVLSGDRIRAIVRETLLEWMRRNRAGHSNAR